MKNFQGFTDYENSKYMDEDKQECAQGDPEGSIRNQSSRAVMSSFTTKPPTMVLDNNELTRKQRHLRL